MKVYSFENFGVVIAGGGGGSRFGTENKLLANLAGKPVFVYSLEAFLKLCPPENIAFVAPEMDFAKFADGIKKHFPRTEIKVVCGGTTRMKSVFNGLAILPEELKFAVIHDAARPIITPDFLSKCFEFAEKHDSAVIAKRITDTVKIADKDLYVLETLDRKKLWTVETPQIFIKKDIEAAYRKAFEDGFEFTDDAGVMEHSGYKVHLMEHFRKNIKITFPEDIKEAEFRLQS